MDSIIGRTVFFGRGDQVPEEPPVMPPAPIIDEALPSKEITYGFSDESDHDNDVENGVNDVDDQVITDTVVSLAEVEGNTDPLEDDDDDDVPANIGAPVAPMDLEVEAPATAKKRGRPSASASASRTGTPALKGRTPGRTPARATQTPSTNGIKRKATDATASVPPSAKRGRPAGARVPSARKAAKAAAVKTSTAGRRKAAAGTKAPKVPGKRGRPAKTVDDEDDAESFKVEKIMEDAIDADTMQHMFLIKWQGYPDSDNTWEPRANLHCEDLITAFDKAKKKAAAAEKAKAPKVPKAAKTPKALKVKAAKVVKASTGRKRGRPARKTKA